MVPRLTAAKLLRRLAGSAVAAAALCGCSSHSNPFTYNDPPTVAKSDRSASGGATIVVGSFDSPQRSSVRWRDIGPGMSDALVRTLINRGEFDARLDARFAREARAIIAGSPDQREARLEKLRGLHPDVRYVITGSVTDFHHTDDVPRETRRRGLLLMRKREAVVAMQISVIDMDAGRMVATDHIHGTAKASKTPTKELYANVTFGSYLFWNTPLGEASEDVIREAVQALRRVDLSDVGELRIVKQIGPRKVIIAGGPGVKRAGGREYFVCTRDEATGRLEAILDRDTGDPIRARIADGGSTPMALLMGLKPLEVSLRGALLTTTLPASEPAAPEEPGRGEDAPVSQTAAAR